MAAHAALPGSSVRLADWSDSELLSRLLARDDAAWAEFLRRYRRLMYRCILKVTDRQRAGSLDVDDVFAEVLLGLVRDDMRKLRLYDPSRGTRLSSWIGLITTNAAHDYLRSAGRRPQRERCDEGLDMAPDERARSPLDELIDKERWSSLNEALSRFSARDRAFMELYYAHGLDAAAVAEHMAISLKTVYSKKHKIRDHLRRHVRTSTASALHDLAA